MKPSDLKDVFPWGSVLHKSEDENNMGFLINLMANNGNTWGLSYERYLEIEKDKQYPFSKEYFSKFEKYLKSEDTIILFSNSYDLKNK